MPYIFKITLIGLIAGVGGTSLGGLIASLGGKPRKSHLSFMLAFAGGIMIAVVFQDLIPEALEYGSFSTTVLGLAIGVGFLLVIDNFIPHAHVSATPDSASAEKSKFVRTSILIGLGIAMHNLPEGMAIGAGYIASKELGLGLALVLAFHNIPEGMAMGVPMKAASMSFRQIIRNTTLAGIPTGIGALIGAIFGGISPVFLSGSLGFAAGAMLYLVFDELLPVSQELTDGHSSTYGAMAGIVFGLIFLMLI